MPDSGHEQTLTVSLLLRLPSTVKMLIVLREHLRWKPRDRRTSHESQAGWCWVPLRRRVAWSRWDTLPGSVPHAREY